MTRYLQRRLAQALLMSVGVLVLTFVLVRASPGDPIVYLTGERSSPEYQAQLRKDLGLDQPLHVQLVKYLSHVTRGDLGHSFVFQQSVLSLILQRVPPTLLLMAASLVLSTLLGVLAGVHTAVHPRSGTSNAITVGSLVGYSLPSFWLAEIMMLFFAVRLQWFPLVGMSSLARYTGLRYWIDVGWHMVLPTATLTAFNLALFVRLTRASMREVLDQDYIVSARGKGLSERVVIYRHGLRNALLPVVTVFGLNLGSMLAGFVLVENVFGWPGLGRLTFEAISTRDFPLISGLFVFVSEAVILANLLTDLTYAFIDPRIRYG